MVFEPFAFSGPSNTRSRGGIGLGLSITKRLVELHRGGIEIVSEVGPRHERAYLPVAAVGGVASRVSITEPSHDRRACGRPDPHIEDHQSAAREKSTQPSWTRPLSSPGFRRRR